MWATPSAVRPSSASTTVPATTPRCTISTGKSLRLIAVVAVTLTLASMVIIPYVARFFVGYDPELLALTSRAFRLYALSFVILGFLLSAKRRKAGDFFGDSGSAAGSKIVLKWTQPLFTFYEESL